MNLLNEVEVEVPILNQKVSITQLITPVEVYIYIYIYLIKFDTPYFNTCYYYYYLMLD